MDEELTCSICFEVFREPVSLPSCGHTYCRECLTKFAENSRSTRMVNSVAASETDKPLIISCPICRSTAHLGREGVTGLSVNNVADEAVRIFQADGKCEANSALCSMCDEDKSTPAVKFCSVCCILYCEPCLSTVHPMKGPLKRHKLITVEECLSLGDGLGPSQTETQSHSLPTCQQHRQSYSRFCVTCEQLICSECFDDHDEHRFSKIKSVSHKLRAPFLEEVTKCEELKKTLDRCGGDNENLRSEIESHETAHLDEANKAYKLGQESLEDWRQTTVDRVKTKHEDWKLECGAVSKDINMKREEIRKLIEMAKDILSSHDAVFLQGSKQLMTNISKELPATTTTVKNQVEIKEKLENCMRLDPVSSKQLIVKEIMPEQTVSTSGQIGAKQNVVGTGNGRAHHSGKKRIMEDSGIKQLFDDTCDVFTLLKEICGEVKDMDFSKNISAVTEQLQVNLAQLTGKIHTLEMQLGTDIESEVESKGGLEAGSNVELNQTSNTRGYYEGSRSNNYQSLPYGYGFPIGGGSPSDSSHNSLYSTANGGEEISPTARTTETFDELYKQYKSLCCQLKPTNPQLCERFAVIGKKFEWNLRKSVQVSPSDTKRNEGKMDHTAKKQGGFPIEANRNNTAGLEGIKIKRSGGFGNPSIKCVVHVKTSLDCDLRGADQAFFKSVNKELSNHSATLELIYIGLGNINQRREGTSILVCPITSRLGSSVDSALRKANCTSHSRLALVLFHHQPRHLQLAVESERLLTDPQYSAIPCMVDVVFWQNEGMYDCQTNRDAQRKLCDFILRKSRVQQF